jgi:simple sugar transport system ATP-binding protein
MNPPRRWINESERLFAVVRRLQQQGIGVVFISHRIHELKAICDTLTVLRDGKLIESARWPLSGEQIVEKMLGHELSDIFPPPRRRTRRCCCRLTVCTMRRC